MPKVSIVVPIYNVEKYLCECLDSVVSQTLRDIEIICVNDGSTDGSLAIMEEYAKNDDRVRVISKANAGYGHSMNVGFDAATGEYLGIVESDDYAEPEMFETLYNTAVQNNADVVKSNFYFYYSKPEVRNEFFEITPAEHCNQVKGYLAYRKIFYRKPSIWSAIYKKDFIRKNGIRFTETPGASYQDAAFNFKVWACSERSVFLHEAYLHYRQDNEASSVNSKGKVFCVCDEYEEMERFLDRHPDKKAELECLKNRIKYDSYMWNYDRLAVDFRPMFLERMAAEFRLAKEKDKLDKSLFEPWKWDTLHQIIADPAQYHLFRVKRDEERKRAQEMDEIQRLQAQLDSIRNSRSYKIGRGITYIPRMGHRGLRALKKYGVRRTVGHIAKKISKRK